ncbi:MAG: chromosomal replication initiator protein DnaA [candidate division Zixibacteria bacterium]|nr:chromosomal replication initiator protein DnaA [candidate division Zixibacteria bacterium]
MEIDNGKLWGDCLSHLSRKIRKQSFCTWLKATRGIPSPEGTIRVAVPNKFVADWLEEHYLDLIKTTIRDVTQKDFTLAFHVSKDSKDYHPQMSMNFDQPSKKRHFGENPPGEMGLNPKYTFDAFVVGDSNQFAQAASLAVAEAPGRTKFNPLYIYGGVGLGKTHLVQAIGHLARDAYEDIKVLYVTSEKFTSDFINSLTSNTTRDFVNLYRNVDVLLLDDIQFFTGKESTQVQFFHTFNVLYQNGKQIVLTSDRPPREIRGVEERLLSRFQQGLVTDIQPPDLETRIAILNKKTESDGISIPIEVATFIADNVTSNIRELEGSLIRLLAYASLNSKEITVDLAKEVLKDTIRNGTKPVTIEQIQKKVATSHNLSPESLCSKRKTQEIALARQVAMYLARSLTNNSLKTIGLHFGGRDHSTVIHACTQVAENLKKDYNFKLKMDEIINSLYV